MLRSKGYNIEPWIEQWISSFSHTPPQSKRESLFNLFGGAIVNSLDSYPQGKSYSTYPVGIPVCLAKSSAQPTERVCVSPVKSKSDLSLS